MTYRRISKKQIAYVESLAAQTGETLPWGYEAFSGEKAATLIRKLQHQLAAQSAVADQPEQLGLL